MLIHKDESRGFTIVELLIVIVVIAILAAISIVAYNGIQDRAQNSSKISAASAILRSLNGYITATGQYPPGIPFCLPIGAADYSGDSIPDCGNVAVTPMMSEKSATNAALAAEKIKVSYPAEPLVVAETARFVGIEVTYSSSTYGMNGILQPYFLYFFLKGRDQDCGNSASIDIDSSQADPLYKIVSARNYTFSASYTVCAYTLRSPANL